MYCGHPTSLATSHERTAWELEQWRADKLQTSESPSSTQQLDSPHLAEQWPLHAPAPTIARAADSGSPVPSKPPGPEEPAKPEGIEIDLRMSNASVLVRGRSRGRAATLRIDQAAVFLERDGRGRRRWMPLEEIDAIKRTETALIIQSTAEQIRLECRDPGVITRAVRILSVASAEARLGFRHDPDVMQAWCELTSDLWKGALSRHRIKARKAHRI